MCHCLFTGNFTATYIGNFADIKRHEVGSYTTRYFQFIPLTCPHTQRSFSAFQTDEDRRQTSTFTS